MEQLSRKKHYTYADYLTWPDNQRCEIIDGVVYVDGAVYAMAPAPAPVHQSISMEIARQLSNFLMGHTCKVFCAPFDVVLADDTVVQPDIVVICDRAKIDEKGCKGAPDLVIEITSPASSRHDKVLKFNKYQQSGVKEYWIVEPQDQTVQVFLFQGDAKAMPYGEKDQIPVGVLPGCTVELELVFAE